MKRRDWAAITWAEEEVGRALVELAVTLQLKTGPEALEGAAPGPELTEEQLDRWLVSAASHVSLRLEPTDSAYADLYDVLGRLGPCLLRLELGERRRYLAVVASTERRSSVLTPTGGRAAVPRAALWACLTEQLQAAAAVPVRGWLSTLRVPARRVRRAEGQLLELILEERRVSGLYLVRPDPGSDFSTQLRARGLWRRAFATLVLCVCHVALTFLGWVLLGRAAASGPMETGWSSAWLLLTLTAFPLQLAVIWLGGALLQDVSALLKQRLLCGALRIDADLIRSAGSGRLLAMVSESAALESAGLAGAFGLVLSFVQLAGAALVMAAHVSGPSQLLLLLMWCVFMGELARRYFRQRAAWTDERFELARAFVQNVVGHRTRAAQQPERRWHALEDQQLDRYAVTSARMDAAQTRLTALPARGWLLLGCLGLLPTLLMPGVSFAELALALGALLGAYGALGALTAGALTLGSAKVAWGRVGELFHAASRLGENGNPRVALGAPRPAQRGHDPAERAPVLDVRGLAYRYPGRHEPILQSCELRLLDGDRVLLEGPSGAGKSTLAALIVGLRQPDAGHVLLSGLDRATLGQQGFRQRVASAPQFHENHILSASFAFNLLMGRAWPASAADLLEAEEICRVLGLGPLLRRMPSGMHQIIGETGWQLSHGERSRLFLARALLQRAELIVLDETFGALDPGTLSRCMHAVLGQARTLIVIAHP